MSRRLTALLCALCLLTGCAASAPASDSAAQSAGSGSAAVEPAPEEEKVSDASAASEDAETSAAADAAPGEESELPAGGSAAGLEWRFERKKFSTTESSGREVYYFGFTYPVFSGEGSEALNDYVNSNYLNYMAEAEAQSGVDDSYLDDYRESMDEETLANMLPFFDELTLDTVWANEEYLSLSGHMGFWSGGAHPYTYRAGTVVRRSDAQTLSLDELIDTSNLPEQVREHFPEDAYADDPEFRADTIERITGMADVPEAFALEDGGLRLYYNVGDAVPRLEILLPFSELKMN